MTKLRATAKQHITKLKEHYRQQQTALGEQLERTRRELSSRTQVCVSLQAEQRALLLQVSSVYICCC